MPGVQDGGGVQLFGCIFTMIKTYSNPGVVHKTFVLGVLLKAINAILQMAGGGLFLLASPERLHHWMTALTLHGFVLDPDGFLVRTLLDFRDYCTTEGQIFLAVYLLSHGGMKIVVIAALLCGKRWAYPAMGLLLILFIVYQVYRYSFTHSQWLIWLTILDLALLLLTWLEYRHVRQDPSW